MIKHKGVLVYDCEADGLYDPWLKDRLTKLHCICATDHSGHIYIYVDDDRRPLVEMWLEREEPYKDCTLGKLEDFPALVAEYDALVAHNQIHYDLPVLKEFLEVDYDFSPMQFNGKKIHLIDTLVESRMNHPDRPLASGCPTHVDNPVTGKKDKIGPHGLMGWAYRTGGTKPVVHDWRNQHITTYVDRCVEDVKNNLLTFDALTEEFGRWYKTGTTPGSWANARFKNPLPWKIEHVFSHIMFKQAQTGVAFNSEWAQECLDKLYPWMKELEDKWEPKLPETPIPISILKRDYKLPGRHLKRDGTPTSICQRFLDKWNATYERIGDSYEPVYIVDGKRFEPPYSEEYVTTTQPLRLSNSDGIKQYLLKLGWSPMHWNYQRDPATGRPMRDSNRQLIPTTPRIKDAASGNICDNLLAMENEFAKDYVLYCTLKHRRQTILSPGASSKGLMNHPRLEHDGRLPAEGNPCGASTLRVTHRTVANVPKAEEKVIFGKEMRMLYYAGSESTYLLGYDASGIEARLDGHEAFEFDKGAYAHELLSSDVHQANTDAINSLPFMQGKEITRSQSKGIKYGLSYGAQAGKVAQMLNIDIEDAKGVVERYWEQNWATKMAIEKFTKEWERNGKKCISSCAGNPLWVRAQHSIFNTRLQNAGAIAMKLAACLTYNWNKEEIEAGKASQIIHYHDEINWEVDKSLVKWRRVDSEEEAAKLMKDQYFGKVVKTNGKLFVPYSIIGERGIKSIEEAGKLLSIKVPLTGEYMVGRDWSEIH